MCYNEHIGGDVYLRWIRNPVRDLRHREDLLCFHAGPGRYALSPQVIESYRNDAGVVRKRLVWTPGPAIRTCCARDAQDPVPRVLWWGDVSERIDALRARPASLLPLMLQQLLAGLPGMLNAMARTVAIPTADESEFVEAWANSAARQRGESLHAWYVRCWTTAQERLKQAASDPTRITHAEALALLGLAAFFTPEELKKAYRRAAFEAHPDRAGGSHAQFIRVGAAYELLRNS